MAYDNSYEQVEAEYGEPMGVVLPRLANEFPSLKELAEHLRVHKVTLWKWAKRVGLRSVYVTDMTCPADKQKAE